MTVDNSAHIHNSTDLKKGFNQLTNWLKEHDIALLSKSYFYINIWSINCKPCSDEMPFLDSLSKKMNKELAYLMVSSHSDEAVNNFLKNNKIQMNNFCFINKMNDFISGVYNELKFEGHTFPLHILLDNKGNLLAYLIGAFHNENSASPLINFINDLK